MSDSMDFDFSELDKLAADLGTAADVDGGNLRKMMQVAATNVKKGWANRLKGSAYASGTPGSITYDIEASAGAVSEISAEIGPDLSRSQGPIAGLIETGSPKKNLAPHGFGLAALNDEQDDFQDGAEKVVKDALKKANL